MSFSVITTASVLRLFVDGLLALDLVLARLEAELLASPGLADLGEFIVEALLDSLDEGGELSAVLTTDIRANEGDSGGGLLADDLSETGLSLDDGVGDSLLAAESGEPEDELDGVDVVSDQDEGSLLLLNKGGDVLETKLDERGLGAGGEGLSLLNLSGLLHKTDLLLSGSLGSVLVRELEKLEGFCYEKKKKVSQQRRKNEKRRRQEGESEEESGLVVVRVMMKRKE